MSWRIQLLLGLLSCVCSFAHSALPNRESIDTLLNQLGADREPLSGEKVAWSVLPGPFYTPELHLGLGAAIAGVYQVAPPGDTTQNSSVSFTGFISTSGASGIGVHNYTFFAGDKWRFFLDGNAANVPTKFWGTGYDAAQGESCEYRDTSLHLHPTVFHRLAGHFYFGVGWDYSTRNAHLHTRESNSKFSHITSSTSPVSSGITFNLNYDSRDVITRAQQGQFFNLAYRLFSPRLGSDTHFSTTELQYNVFFSLDARRVLALDAWGQFTHGDVPWDRLAQAGDDHRLRGYYQGRYRDNDVVSLQVEYRQKMNWRHGLALWAGVGTLGAAPEDLFHHPLLPTVGVGYRFEVKPEMNIRLDLGVGRDSAGFYFQVAEAF